MAHGSSDGMRLGGQLIDTKEIIKQAKELANWQIERLVLWSCELGQNLELIQQLKEITGAKIFSSKRQINLDNTEIYSDKFTLLDLYSVIDHETLRNWQGNLVDLVGGSSDGSTSTDNSSFEYYVSKDGDDANLGTIDAPFRTIQHAINNVEAGDVVNIRGGIYREELTLEGIQGTEDNWITFQNYNEEDVLLSGAKQIKSPWSIHEGSIWKTNVWSEDIQFDISQLFIDDKMLTGARWPNIKKDYDQPDADFWHNWSSANKVADGSYEDNGGLEELSVSVEGATAYFKGKGAAVITSHNAGESQFLSNPQANNITSKGKLGDGDYFIEGDIDLLDTPREWYYDNNNGDLFVWLENDQNPNDANIEARTHEKGNYGGNNLIQINDSNNLKIDGLNLFSGAFSIINSNHIAYENSSFLYPAHNGLMLGENHFPGGNVFKGERNYSKYLTLKNNEFAYSYGLLFDAGGNSSSDIHLENNHFHNSNIMLWGSNGGPVVMGQSNVTAIRNSVHDMGWGGLGRPGQIGRASCRERV